MEVKNSSNSTLNLKADSSLKIQQNQLLTDEKPAKGELVSSAASMATKAYAAPQVQSSPSFGCRYEKIIKEIMTSQNPSKIQLSYDEACNVLEHLGYALRHHNGSHFVATSHNKQAITIVFPHGHHKFVDPAAIKDIKTAINARSQA